MVDGITAGAADTDDFDDRRRGGNCEFGQGRLRLKK
jgi:hypothetical protein